LIYELAGIVGINPDPFTLRELLWMAEGKGRENWNHTASILALIFNVNRDSKKHHAARPSDFNPYALKPKPKLRGGDLRILKDIFVKEEPNGNVRRH